MGPYAELPEFTVIRNPLSKKIPKGSMYTGTIFHQNIWNKIIEKNITKKWIILNYQPITIDAAKSISIMVYGYFK